MGTPATPEASEIRRRGRQRLLGAVAIALVLIVFVPMILDSDPRAPRNDSALVIPPKENAPPLPAPLPAAQPTAPAETKSAPPPAAKVAVVEPRPAAPGASTPPSAPRQGFAVQVGAFRDDTKLAQARERLQAAKIAHYTEPAGDLTRLRAGPFSTKDAADKAVVTIRKTHPEAKVIPLP